MNQAFDLWTKKTHEGNACWNSHSSTWETIPFFGPEVSRPEINDETLGKISKAFSQFYKFTFSIKKILTAVLYLVLNSETG